MHSISEHDDSRLFVEPFHHVPQHVFCMLEELCVTFSAALPSNYANVTIR